MRTASGLAHRSTHIAESSGFRVTKQDTLFSFGKNDFVVHPPPSAAAPPAPTAR